MNDVVVIPWCRRTRKADQHIEHAFGSDIVEIASASIRMAYARVLHRGQ